MNLTKNFLLVLINRRLMAGGNYKLKDFSLKPSENFLKCGVSNILV